MVQPAFEIGTTLAESLPDEGRLLIEVSGQSLNYILYTREPYQLFLLRQYRMYTTSDRTIRDLLEEIISGDPVLTRFAPQATVVYNFPGADIVPSEFYNEPVKNAVAQLM